MQKGPPHDETRFSTESLLPDLGRRSARGGVVTLAAQAIRFGLQIGSTAVLARLLEVSDFGLVAMVTAVTGFVALFQDGGLSMATVQRARLTHEQASNLFWVNVLLGLLAMIVTAGLAPVVAWVYGRPELVEITLVAATAFLFGGAGVQPLALLRRTMRFRTVATVDVAAMAAGVAAAILLATRGAGYWALVAMPIVTAAAKSLAALVLCRWLPSLPSRGSAVRELIGFGQKVIAFDAVNYFARRADDMMIGWQWGAEPLGLYSKAYALLLMPMHQITQPLTTVAVPALSALRSAPERYRNLYCRGLEAASLAGVPIVVLIFLLAPELVQLVLGDRWAGAVPIFRALAPAALMATTNIATGWVYLSWGHVGRQLRWGVVSSIVLVGGMALGLRYGAMGVAIAVSVTRVGMKLPGLWYCYLDTPLRLRHFFAAIWRSMLAAAVAGGALVLLRDALDGRFEVPIFVELVALFAAYGLGYAACLVAIPGGLSRLLAIRDALMGSRARPPGSAEP